MMRKFGSMVGISVCAMAGAGGVALAVWDDESVISGERGEPTGVQGMGWKGVGVGDAFGAEVTITKG